MAAALGLVALAAVAVGWLENADHITRAEAVAVAESAYEAAGMRGAVVDPRPAADVYIAGEGRDRVAVWKTTATLDGGTVQLWLSRADAESVFLDDRAPDGSSQLLTDVQFRRLADHYENPAVTRQVRRNLILTLAAALIALLAVRLSVKPRRNATPRPSTRRRLRGRTPAVSGEPRASRLRRIPRIRRRERAGATQMPPPSTRPAPRPGRPIRARQETS